MIGDILQPTHLLFVLVIALLVLGPKRLPEVGRSLGRGIRDFKDALSTEDRDRHNDVLTQTGGPSASVPAEPVAAPVAPSPVPEVPEPAAPAPEPAAPASEPAEHAG